MFRYDSNLSAPEDDTNSSTSILFPSSGQANKNWPKLVEADRIFASVKKRKRCIILGVCIVGLLIAFIVLFSTLHSNMKVLQDVYPEKTEKMTVYFPDEPMDVPNFVPMTSSSAPPTSTQKTTTVPVTIAPILPPVNPKPLNDSIVTSGLPSSSNSLPDPKAISIQPPHPPHRTKNKKSLPENVAEMDAISLLQHMRVIPEYTFYYCTISTQMFGVSLTVMHDDKDLTFGPVFGIGKKNPKRMVAELATNYLYGRNYTGTPDLDPTTCGPQVEQKNYN